MEAAETVVVVQPSDFDAFCRAEYRSVMGLAYALCGDFGRAEDLTQEAFAAAHSAWPKIGDYNDPGAWVRRVVANKATSLRRRRSAENRALGRFSVRRHDAVGETAVDTEAVWDAVRALPRRQAQAVALTFLDGLDTSEVAAVLQCGEATVKTHLHRAKSTLAKQLGLNFTEADR